MVRAYIGTYTKKESQGIYKVELTNEGRVEATNAVAKIENPTYLALNSDATNIYSVSKTGDKGSVTSFKILEDGSLEELTHVAKEGNPPCYVELSEDDKYLLSANYHTGTVDSYSVLEDGSLEKLLSTDTHEGSGVHPRQEKPHVHFAGFSPKGNYVFTCDLGTDELTTYRLNDGVLEKVKEIKAKAGSGVRHITFSSDEKKAYVMTELTSEIIAFDYDGKGNLENPKYYQTLPKDFEGENKGSAIVISNDNRFIYVSNRGEDAIVVFEAKGEELEHIQTISTFGRDPRDFALSKEGSLAIATNETTGTITVYAVDKSAGRLSVVEKEVIVPEAVCVKFV